MDFARVTPALDYIDANLAGDLSVGALARASGLSHFEFHRRFRASVGESPRQYVRRLRLERAALWLNGSRRPVTEIAYAAGYATHESFTRAFKSRFGVPPLEFRAELPRAERPRAGALSFERLAPRTIAFARHVGPYDRIDDAFALVAAFLAERGLVAAEWLGIFHDDQRLTAAGRTRCHAAAVVPRGTGPCGAVEVRELAGGDHAVFSHSGSVAERRALYAQTYRSWLPALGRRAAEMPPFEAFLGGGVTRVHVPLLPA